MSKLDVKKLITGFLILAAIVSSSVFLLSDFVGGGPPETVVKQNQDKGKNGPVSKVPDNVFVEPIPSSTAVSGGNETSDDGLPPVGTSSNLTDRLAENLTRNMVETNPDGPNQTSDGKLSAQIPNIDSAIKKTFPIDNLDKSTAGSWKINISNSDIKLLRGGALSDIENYLESFKEILKNNAGSPKLITLVQGNDSSADTINAVSVAIDQEEINLKKLSVPEPLLKFHKNFLTLLAYQKNAVAAVNSDDPLSGALALQTEEKNYYQAISDFENESKKLPSIIKNYSLKGDSSSILANLLEIRTAHAFLFFDVPTEIATALTWAKIVWGYVRSIILQTVKNQIVHKIMAQTINWIQGGGKPKFITNWKGFIGKAGQDAVALAIQNKVPGLCRSFGPLIKIQLQNVYLSNPPQQCTLEEVVQNVKNFYNDFAMGGWIGYSAMILPSGNYFGQLFATTQEIEQEKKKAKDAAKSDAESSRGFLSTKTCEKYAELSPHDQCTSEVGQMYGQGFTESPDYSVCDSLSNEKSCEEYKNTTPGEVASEAVANTISAPLHNIVNAQDIVGLVSALINSAINRLFQAGVKGLIGLTMKDHISGDEPSPPGFVTIPNATDIYNTEVATEDNSIPKQVSCGTEGNDPGQQPIADDLSNVVVDWSQDANITGWPVSANNHLDSVTFSGNNLCLNHTPNPLTWPDQADGTFADTPANGWVMIWRNGQWHAGTFEYYYRSGTQAQCRDAGNVWDNAYGAFGGNFNPVPGETYGFMLSGLARAGHRNVQERTNVVMQTWTGPACITGGSGSSPTPTPTPTPTPSPTPTPTPTPTPAPTPSTKFVIGDRMQVSSGPLNVRATPTTSGTLLGTQATGVLGTVVAGPTAADGFNWWNISYDTGVDGWSAEDFLVKVAVTPPPTPTSVQPTTPHLIANAGQYTDSKGVGHGVNVWAFTNTQSGGTDYFVLAQPSVSSPPYPTIVLINPYSVFPAPPGSNPEDSRWSSLIQQPGPYYDVSLPSKYKFLSCSTSNSNSTGDCVIPTTGIAPLTNLLNIGDVSFEGPNSNYNNADWALINGYAVAIPFVRHYAGRDISTVIYDIAGVIDALKGISSIDGAHIGIMGRSQGGELSIHPLVLKSIAAAVAEASWTDARAIYNYYFTTLPGIQPPSIYTQSRDFAVPGINRIFAALGADPNNSRWDPLTTNYIAPRFNTPILLIDGTDDGMIPISETTNLYTALKSNGKVTNKWVYQNGPPPLTTKSVSQIAHGVMDSNSPIKRRVLARNFFLQYMPPNVSEVVYNVPGDVDLVAMLSSFRSTICSSPAEKENISGLIIQAANSKIKYQSLDAKVPTGNGPAALAAAINAVWTKENITWTKDNVINNLQNGLLPSNCSPAP